MFKLRFRKKWCRGRGKFLTEWECWDVGQNHLMQLIAAVAMEQPKSFTKKVKDTSGRAIKSIKHRIFRSFKYAVRGQYEDIVRKKMLWVVPIPKLCCLQIQYRFPRVEEYHFM